jgi:hypothetical protein
MIKKFLPLFVIMTVFAFGQSGPKVAVLPENYDFGEVTEGKVLTYDFTIKNTGSDMLLIKEVHPTCGCTIAKIEKKELKKGESTKVAVSFNTDGRPGKQHKAVDISTNDPENPYTQFEFTATVNPKEIPPQPNIYFKEMTFNFGKVKEGKVVTHTFNFTNNGKALLEVKDIKTSCGCTAAIVSSKKIEPGQNGTIRVDLDTANRSGSMSRTVTITTNDPDEAQRTLTVMVDIQK